MDLLEQARLKINQIDEQMAELFVTFPIRFHAAIPSSNSIAPLTIPNECAGQVIVR